MLDLVTCPSVFVVDMEYYIYLFLLLDHLVLCRGFTGPPYAYECISTVSENGLKFEIKFEL